MPDIVTGKIFVDGEKGITATKLNQIISQAVIQPSFVTSKPASSTLDPTDQLLAVKGVGTYATLSGQQLIDSVSTSVLKLRTNTIGNPNFEVDQRNNGALVSGITGAGTMVVDRWECGGVGTLRYSAQQMGGSIVLPGTTYYYISSKFLRLTLTTVEATLGANDWMQVWQTIEGPFFRAMGDVHSVSILCRSNVANLKFGLNIGTVTGTNYVLNKLCTLGAANTWTLVTLPGLPVWTPSATWPITPGSAGYYLGITLAAGTSQTVSANDVWVASSALGAIGQSNFAATPGATFDLAFVQHEPSSQSSTLIDKPYTQNFDECLRYFCRSYDLGVSTGTVGGAALNGTFQIPKGAGSYFNAYVPFPKPMAKIPTVTIYNYSTGAANSFAGNVGAMTVSSLAGVSTRSFSQITPSSIGTNVEAYGHFVADTGW